MPDAGDHRRDWEAIASLDPHWAVLSDPARKHGRWDDTAFFSTGEAEVSSRLEVAARRGVSPASGEALDFGCGLGRTARALAVRFEHCVGVDIAAPMIEQARGLNAAVENLEFVMNRGDDLSFFEDGRFDLTYTSIVLQHLQSQEEVTSTLLELARVTSPSGLMIFQVPNRLSLSVRLQPRRSLYRALGFVGLSPEVRYRRLGLHPMSMLAVPGEEVEGVLASAGRRVVHTERTTDPEFGFQSSVYYAA